MYTFVIIGQPPGELAGFFPINFEIPIHNFNSYGIKLNSTGETITEAWRGTRTTYSLTAPFSCNYNQREETRPGQLPFYRRINSFASN